jgi:hypothetical protein
VRTHSHFLEGEVMSDPRITGVLLMSISIAAFMGTTSNFLPSMTFFPALVLFGTGAVKFMRTNHDALEEAERRTHRALNNPVIFERTGMRRAAERQAARQGESLSHSGALDSANHRSQRSNHQLDAPREIIDIDNMDEEFVVATDVSFPIAIQAGDALADQLGKLKLLLEQGVLTAEQYAVAKTKILS